MTPNHFKIQLLREFPDGFVSVLITQPNGRETHWVLADAVVRGLMARQNGLDINSTVIA
jgi:hypothetical protein